MKLLCKIGLHNNRVSFKYYPSIDADIVTHGHFISTCLCCGKTKKIGFDYINEKFKTGQGVVLTEAKS